MRSYSLRFGDIDRQHECVSARGFDVPPRAFKPILTAGDQTNVEAIASEGDRYVYVQ